jgi:hypothetical protein
MKNNIEERFIDPFSYPDGKEDTIKTLVEEKTETPTSVVPSTPYQSI